MENCACRVAEVRKCAGQSKGLWECVDCGKVEIEKGADPAPVVAAAPTGLAGVLHAMFDINPVIVIAVCVAAYQIAALFAK